MNYMPDGYTEVTPYLTVVDAHKLLHYLVAVFDAQMIRKVEESDGRLKHAAVKLGSAHIEMSEASEEYPPTPAAMHIYVPDVDATHGRAIEHGGEVIFEPMDMDYGERSSAVKDPFGNNWYIATWKR